MLPTWTRLRGRNGKSPNCQKAPKLSGTQQKADTCLRHDLMASLKLTNETPVTMHMLLYARFCLTLPYIICPKTQPGVLSSPCDCSTHRPCVNNKKIATCFCIQWLGLGSWARVSTWLRHPLGGLSFLQWLKPIILALGIWETEEYGRLQIKVSMN